jgi:anti-anti-sigma factor
MLRFTIHNLGDVVVFECTGRITVEGGSALRDAVLRQPYVERVVLDLKGISDIDAAGLGVLATLRSWSNASGTELKLMNVMPRVENALKITGLKPAFSICSARDMLDLWCRALHFDVLASAAPARHAVAS